MKKEVLSFLNPKSGGIYVDATVGEGGHAMEILKAMDGEGIFIGIDCDSYVLDRARENTDPYGADVRLVQSNYSRLKSILRDVKIEKIDGILCDLGISSFQLNSQRGFSFNREGPLDMRMDPSLPLEAGYYLNNLSLEELTGLLKDYGEVRGAYYIARGIVSSRSVQPLKTTEDLAKIILRYLPRRFWPRKIHPATQTFQALRIKVNKELENLPKSLSDAIAVLKPEGRICVLSYHSLEDRIVKQVFKTLSRSKFRVLTARPAKPSKEELRDNPRARSARLRAGEVLN